MSKDVTGLRFGRLLALRPATRTRKGWKWECLCDCGQKHEVLITHLGNSVNSCGCLRREIAILKIQHTHTGATKDRRRWLLWNGAKCRASKQKVPFSLALEDIIIPKVCPLLKIPLRFNRGKVGNDSPTLDKIIPRLGYVRGNIQVISAEANRIKDRASLEELEMLVKNWKALS